MREITKTSLLIVTSLMNEEKLRNKYKPEQLRDSGQLQRMLSGCRARRRHSDLESESSPKSGVSMEPLVRYPRTDLLQHPESY